MVVAVYGTSSGPGKFYGTSLPQLPINTDTKLNDEQADLSLPVLDPFIS